MRVRQELDRQLVSDAPGHLALNHQHVLQLAEEEEEFEVLEFRRQPEE
ncbi:hypothetical protein MYX77_06520 [Acidobacteriia bacterium AH_259_A11_L15]|nr:hypothetical protein [Acidobacteriia bacterium AH_259_A11_L15]